MRVVIGCMLFLCLLAFVGSAFLSREAMRDPGRPLPVVFGVPMGNKIQIHLGVPPTVPLVDPPNRDPDDPLSWPEWVEEHFQLRKKDGSVIPLQRMGTSGLLLGEKAAGAPEFALWAEIEQGQEYEFDFIPIMGETKVYRHVFTAPTEQTKVFRENFALVPEKK